MKKSAYPSFSQNISSKFLCTCAVQKLMHLLVFGLFLFSASNAFATIRYVKAGAAGNGSSWSAAGDLQAMINASAAGDQVWVAAGTYKPNAYPNGCSDCGTDNGNYAFSLKDNVAIYGGFAGNEADLSQRNFRTQVTILSGDIGTANNNSDNCYHVIFSISMTKTAVLDGFTVTAGNASNGSASTTISGAEIPQYNGGGMFNYSSSPSIANCIFKNNSAITVGGAIANFTNSSPVITNCVFSNNIGGNGGAITNSTYSPAKITNCVFYGNTASNSMGSGGGGIYNYSSDIVVTNCSFISNTSATSKGVISSFYGSPTFTNCILWNNSGAISDRNSTTNVSYSLVQGGYAGTGNLNTDPLFSNAADPDGADNIFGTADDGLKQQSNSPVVNAGSNGSIPPGITTDITGGARIQQTTVDMGAYEYPCPLPIITGQPQNTSACTGSPATFTVGVTGSNLTYKWYKDGQSARSSSNSATLTINNVVTADAGNYTVDIIGNCGTVTSNAASLTVKSLPSISAQPANTTVCAGGTATFTVAATEANLYYEWYKEGQYFHGSTNSATLTINNVSLSDAGNYTAKIFGSCGTVTSNAASLTIKSAPSISTQPVNTTICAGGTATFTVAATESNLYYEWYKDGQYFHGSTNSATLTINNVLASDAGNFTAKIIGSCGTVTSNAASLTVNVAPSITSCPGNISVNNDPNTCGATVTYSPVISGAPSPAVTYAFSGATTGRGTGTGSGSVFSSGTTYVTVTAYNTCSPNATCNFTVTVTDNTAPVFVQSPATPVAVSQLGRTSAYSNINLNGTGGNIARVIPGTSVTFSFNRNTTVDPGAGGCRLCQTQHYVGIDGGYLNKCQFDEHNDISGSGNYTFAAPTAPGVYYINQSASWNYGCLDNPGYTSGYGSNTIAVLVVGNTSNTLTANNISVNNDAGVCGAVVSYPSITAFDNCSSVTVIQTAGKTSGSVFPSGTTINTFEATDAAGNKATYSFTVTVTDNEKPVPVVSDLPAITVECSVTATAPTAIDNCSGTVTGTTTDPLAYSSQGTYTINWNYKDATGNTSSQTQTVIVSDVTPPSFMLASASTVSISQLGRTSTYSDINLGETGTNVAKVAPGASVSFYYKRVTTVDNGGACPGCKTQHYIGIDGGYLNRCESNDGGNSVSIDSYTFTAPSAPGIYYINQSASWEYGCLQNPQYSKGFGTNTMAILTVGDVSVPYEDIVVNNDHGICGATVFYPSFAATDNCSSATVTQTAGKPSGSLFPSGTTTNTFEAVDAAGNKATYSFTVTVTDNEIPVPVTATLPDVTGICTATATAPTATDNCSGTITATTTDPVTYNTPGNYTIHWTYTDAAGNFAGQTQNVSVSQLAKPVITSGGATTFCTGGSVTLTAPDGYASYTWSNGETTQSINVSQSGSYNVSVTNSNGCTSPASDATNITVNALPAKPVIASGGATTLCTGGSVTLSAPAGSTSYLWSDGETTQSINVSQSGSYTVIVTNSNGCISPASDALTVTVNPLPAKPTITAGSATTICTGSSVTLTAPLSNTYAWSDGETTQSINVSQSGSYTVTVSNASGCSSPASTALTVTVNPLPAKPVITAGGPTTFYDGGSVTLSAPASSSYLWSTTETTQSIVAATSGNYTVTVSNAAGCSAASDAVAVTVKDKPVIDTLSPVADAYVRNGDYATLNYGADTALGVKTSNTKGFSRNTYLKFSLGNVGSVASAKLRIYGSNIASTAVVNALLYPVINDSWTESGINWNNAPAASSPTALGFAAVDNQKKYYDINITDFVKSQFADDKVVSLQLRDPHNNNLALSFNSKEYGANPPQLIVENEDHIAPYIEVKLVGSVTSPNNYNNQVKMVVVASDKGGSGLALTEYSLNNAAFVKYDTAIIINTPGSYTVTARATDGNGNVNTTGVTSFNVIMPQALLTDTLAPVADASVRSDGYAAINYGHDSTFWVKSSNTKSYSRNAYLKFSLMNSISSVSSAKLRIYGYNADTAASVTATVLPVTNDTWYESEINWNNAPKASSSNPLGAVAVSKTPQYYDVDVTAFVKGQFAGDKIVTFLLKDLLKTNSGMIFNSRENAQNQPRLIITAGSGSSNSAAITSIARPSTVQPQPAEEKLSLTAYPNPSTVSFKLTVGSSNLKDRIAVAIFDEGGRMMETRLVNAGETLVLGDRYRAGVYFAQAIQAGKRVNVKIIKQAW